LRVAFISHSRGGVIHKRQLALSGVLMLTLKQVQKSLAISMLVLFVSACNNQEFYEKEFLEGVGVPDDTIDIPSVPTDPTLVEPSPVDPTPVDPTPAPVDPTPVDPTPAPVDPTPVDPTPAPVDPTPVDPTPAPVDPTPVDPTPAPGICGDGTLTNASDRFVQNTAQEGKVDILWVMDDSGSMGDEQDALAFNFNAFITDFISRDVDFQMAVTTTDGRNNKTGRMIGDTDQLNAAAAKANRAKFIQDFSDTIKVGTRGSGQEMGLKTSGDFLSRYQSWMRQDAFLVVVYVSDEQDQSPESVANYVQMLQGLKAQAGMVKAYSIITQEIDRSKQWETIGTRYAEVSQATGGEVADIHQDFYTTLTNFGFKILELIDSFPLSGVPVGSDISITMNGVELASGWTYDDTSRTIRFDRNAIPAEGSIVIAYYQQCVGN
jgi:hypothetical protein